MAIVERTTIKNISLDDKGLPVRKALKLIENSPFKDDIIDIFKIARIKNEFIEIPGADTLVNSILAMEQKVNKFDIITPLNKVRCKGFTDEGQAVLEIAEIKDVDLIKKMKTDLVSAETAYSVRFDYFNDLYDIDKYLSFLLQKEYKDIIDTNISMLEKRNIDNNKEKQFRLIIDEKGKLLARALTSSDRYKDYNIAFSVFVTLIQLHELNKADEKSFFVSNYSLTESEIKVVFKNTHSYTFIDNSTLSFSLELSNDEIKREAVKLNGIFSIEIGDKKDVFIKPEDGVSRILSFTHSATPINVKNKLSDLNLNIKGFISNTIDDFNFVKGIKKPDEIREYLVYKTINAKDKEFKNYKSEILKVLSNRVSTIFQLLDIVKSVDDLFKDEHIQAQDFWRYKLYQALIEEPKKRSK